MLSGYAIGSHTDQLVSTACARLAGVTGGQSVAIEFRWAGLKIGRFVHFPTCW
jgi:hypothetical protein